MSIRRYAGLCLGVLLLLAAPALAQTPTVSFVDANGSAVSTYLEGTRVHVRVEDPAANSMPWSAETIYASLSAGLSGDFESLGLTETGLDTGVFEGSMALDVAGSNQTGVLETSLQAGPPVVRDTLTVQYNSASDTAGMLAGRIELLDDLGRPAAGYTQGDLVRVRLEDHLWYNDPGVKDSVLVAVNVLAVSDEEFITLQETGNNTGIFEGSIPAALYATYDSDGVVGAPVGEQVHAQHSIANLDETLDVSAPLVGSRAEILDRTGKATELVPEAAPIRLRVVDRTIGSPTMADTQQADVSSLFGGDAELVTLAETGADTGVYETELPTAFNFISPTSVGNGRLETGENPGPPHQFDTILLSYNGPSGASSDTAMTYGSETLFVDEWGNDTEVYAVGTTVFIRVIDYNYDQSGAIDLIPVTLFGHTRGDYETINLIETGSHTGVFEGSLPIQYGFYNVSTYDGWLEADPGETIEVRHTDVLGQTASADLAVIRNADIHFFDEQGRPTHEVMEGGYASIRLYNFPGNNSPWDVDNTYVMVRSLLTGDAEFVQVTETDRNTGIFEGTVRLVFSPSVTNGNGTLEVSNGGAPDYAQDTVTASYSDIVQASATTVGARIWMVDRFGQDTESYAVGDLVAVRVEDHNVDDPQVRQTLQAVVVVNPESGDAEGVAVTETGYNTGVFVGSVPSRLYPSKIANNGTLEVEGGDRLEARHVWQHSPQLARDSAVMAASSVLFVDAQNQPVVSYLEGSTAYVRLVYAGGNGSSSVDVTPVTVSAANSADSEILTLTETGGDTGIFTGSIRLSTGSATPNDGFLQTGRSGMEMDTLTVTHTGPNSSASDTAGIEGSRTWFVNAVGNPVDDYARSSRAYLRVEDQSANRPGLYDTVQVTVRSLATGDQEMLTLQETTRDSGVFQGSLPLETSSYGQTYAYPGDGKLQSDAGEEIEAAHTDWMGSTSTDRAWIVYASIEFLDEAGQPTAEVLEGGVARIRMFDPLSSPYNNYTYVTVRSRYGNDQEFVQVTETSYGSHIFEGTIQLRSGGPGNAVLGNNLLETSTSGNPEYRPDELTASYGGAEAQAVAVPSRIRFIDGFGRVVSSFAVGEQAGIRVEDNNLDDPYARGTISVSLREQSGSIGDVESVTLTETGYDTNVYEGSIPLNPPPFSGLGDGRLTVSPGDVLHAEHGNMTTPAASVVEASVVAAQVLFVDANGQPATVYLEGSRAWVRVVDLSANHTPSAESVTVMLRTTLGPDVEQLTLTETGATTGVFMGSIPLRVSTLNPTDGWLTTVQDLGTPHEFDTLRAEYNDAVATAGTISSRTWFVDAYGNPVESYSRGSRAYIRVEDHTADRPGLYDTVQATVRSLATGDQEMITLLETTRDSGIFAGSLPLETSQYGQTYPNPGDGKLQSDAGQEIEAVHTDWTGSTTSSDRATIDYASIEFVDEAGVTTFEFLEGGVARLRVFDPLSGYGGPYYALVRSRYSNDQEYVELAETSYGSHLFEGTIQLRSGGPGGGLQGNNILETSTSGNPEYRPEELTASYGSTAVAVVRPSRVRFIDGFGQVVSSFSVGERVGVRVEDHNLDDPLFQGTVQVNLQASNGDVESVTLTETGYDTNVYEGSIATAPGTPGGSNGTLQVQPGQTIEARHGNATTPNATVAQATINGATVLFVDAAGEPASVYLEGSRAWVRVADFFANQSAAVDSLTVTLRTTLGPDVEFVTLTETGGATGVFTGSIPLRVSTLNPNDGWLTTVQDLGTPHEFDTLRAEYNGAVATIGTISSRTWFVNAYGNPVESYGRGTRAYIRVEDHTADRPGLYDTVQATVRSLATGDQEMITLLETTRDSGIFAGSLPLETSQYGQTYPNPGDGKLQSDAGQEIEAVHTDWTGSTTSSDRATIDYASIEFIDEAGATTFEVLEGGLARIRLFDLFSSPYSGSPTVLIRSRYANDQEYVQLTETSYGSHLFEGTIQLRSAGPGGGLQSNNILETSTSGNPEYRPEELTATYGSTTVAVVRPSRVRFIDGFGQAVSSFAVGDRAGVRVEDHNLDDPLVRGTVQVNIQASNGDVESVTLTETGYDTNIYEGSIPTQASTPASGNGALQVLPGQTIEARHGNMTTPNATVAQAAITGATVLFMDAAGQPATVYLEGSRAYVRVVDTTANQTPSADSLTVTLRTTLGPDVEQLTLTETGGATGVFTGSIPLRVSTLQPNDGWLTTAQDLGTPHEYDTLRAEYNGAVATIATISSRTWFVDAYGNPVESYSRGSRAYIRVEDHTADRPGLYDTVQVTVRSLFIGDQETVTLLETTRDSGIFAGSLPLETSQYGQTYPNPGDGKLQSDAGQEIEAVHTDWTGSTTSSDRATLGYSSIEFVDEAGVTTFEVLEGGLARVRLFDPFSSPYNSPPTVLVRSRYANDQEYVQLAETSYGSHVFEGTIQLRSGGPGGGLQGNNLLETSTSGNPEYRPEELTASYGFEAVAVVRPSRVRFIDGFGQVVSSFAAGDQVGVRVEDHNLDDPLFRGTVQVNIQASNGDVESVTLTETGYDTNVYEGSIASGTGTPAGGNGSLQVLPGETIEARHGNMTTPNATVVQASITGATVLFVDAAGQPASVYLESSRAYVRVVDTTANQTPSADSLAVTLRTTLGPDVETLTLIETGGATGVFTGSIPLRVSTLGLNDGWLTTVQDLGTPHEYDTLRAEYNGSVATIGTISSRTWFIDAAGHPADAYARGTRAYVRVEDHTLDQSGAPDTAQVTVRSLTTGDLETVTLQEVSGGIFEGSLALETSVNGQTFPSQGDGKLQSDANEEIETIHVDWTGSTQSSDRANILYAAVEFVDPSGQVTAELLEGGVARLRVFDLFGSYNSSISVQVRSLYANDQEYVSMTETGYQTHIFEGTIQLHSAGPGGGLQNNNILETSTSGNPEHRQEVVTASYINEARAVVVPSRVWFLGDQGEVVTEYAVGSPVRVRVEDHNAGSAGQVDSVTVSLATPGDSESVTLTETGADTGIFEGSIASGSGSGVIDAAPGVTVTATHGNLTTPNPTRAQAVFTDNHVPLAVDDAAQTEETPVTIPVLANDSDPDSEPLQVASVTQGTNGAVVINGDQTVTYTPASGFVGTDTFTYVASDPRGGRSQATVTVTVVSANHPPTPAADSATTPEDTPVTIAVLANDTDPDNDLLEVIGSGIPSNGTAERQPDGTILYTPENNWSGQVSFTYVVRDPDGLTAYATVTVTVTPVNDPPVAGDDEVTVEEDNPSAFSVTGNDYDIENDALDVTAVTQGVNGAVVLGADDSVTYTPAPNFHGTDSFTYTVSDGNGGTDTATVAVTVAPVNDPPVGEDDTATTPEDTPVTIDVLANDSDPDGDVLDVTYTTGVIHGSAVVNADNTITFTPALDYSGTVTFSYAYTDGTVTGYADVTVTITPVNDAPVAVDDTTEVAEDSSATVWVLTNDSDAEGDTLDVTAVTQGANGSVVLNADETVTYTPNADFHGSDSFTYTVADGNGGTDTATVTVTVVSANDAPTAADDTATTPEDTPVTVSVLANDTDVDNDTLTVSAVTQGTNGTVAIVGGNQVTYTPNADFHGTDSFTYTASDGNGGTDTATVTVTINPTNDAPVADDDAASVVEDDSVAVAVLGNDSDLDGDTLTITAVTQGAHGAVAIAGSNVTYTPAPNYNGTDSFTYTISDGNGGSDTATVSMTVTASNDALTAVDDTATVAEDGSVTVAVLANDTDPENDPLTVVSVTQGTNGAVAIVGNQVTYTPNPDFHGTDSFTYTASDGNGGTGGATVTVTVTPVNDAPVAGDDTASVVEDGSVTISVLGDDTDVDGDTLIVASVTQGTNGTVAIVGSSQVTYTPATDFHGTDSFTYTVSDGNGGTDTANVTVTVGAANDAPVANNDSATTAEDTAVTVSVLTNDTDLDGDTLGVASVTQGANGAVTISGTQVVYTPGANFHGSDSFTYTASDGTGGGGGSATATVAVTVTPVNDAPVAVADLATVAEDGSVSVSVLANDTDVDGDSLTLIAVTQGANGSVSISDSQAVYTPAANYNGPDSFTYTVRDGNGGNAVGTVTVTVTGTNDAPVAVNDSASVAEDGSVVVPVRSNDTDLDGDTLTITAVTQGAHGSVTHNGSTVTYTPAANYNGSDSFTYTISDGNGGTATASVAVTITPVNDPPVAVNDTATTLAEVAVTVNVRANDSDIDSPTLTVTAVTQGAHGSVSISSEVGVTYTPAAGWVGPDSFTYTISDGSGGTSTATVNVTVQAPARVTGNLQVLYTFNEGSGTTVNDVSGVGTPYNLTIGSASAVTWLPGALSLNTNVLVQNTANATKVINACKSSNEVTVEAWVAPDNTTQTGPAAVVTIAQNTTKRDVTLGQSGTAYTGQLRTSTTGNDGTLTSTGAVATTALTHVVYTRSSTGAVRIYVNGTQVATATLTGNFSGWTNYNLALGGEPNGARYWVGDMHLVAIYSRALTAAEARQNWLAGAN